MEKTLAINLKNFGPLDFLGKATARTNAIIVTELQSNFGFKKLDEIIHIYKKAREKANEIFQSV